MLLYFPHSESVMSKVQMLNLVQGKSLYEGACVLSKGNKPSIAHNVFAMKANHYLHINSVDRFMFLGSWSYNDSKYTITYMYMYVMVYLESL